MADKIQIIVTGDKETDRALASLEKNIQRKFTRQALRKAQKDIVLPEARARAPHDTGQLERSLVVRASKRSRRGIGMEVQTRDGMFQGDEFYGAFQEFGTKKMAAQPFLRPALYGNEVRIKNLFVDDLNELIKEARRAS